MLIHDGGLINIYVQNKTSNKNHRQSNRVIIDGGMLHRTGLRKT